MRVQRPLPPTIPEIEAAQAWMTLPEAVSSIFRLKCGEPLYFDGQGGRLAVGLSGEILGDEPVNDPKFRAAKGELHRALASGGIAAVKPDGGIVPAVEWASRAVPRSNFEWAGETFEWRPLRLRRTDFDRLWPSAEKRTGEGTQPRKRGQAPDPDWPWAVAEVTSWCVEQGFCWPLRRGRKAEIKRRLLAKMDERGKTFDESTADIHAKKVYEGIPGFLQFNR